jgi:DNA-binding response OmpR family regulator
MTSVLVVEDDASIRANLARLLRLEGYEVTVAADGSEGLRVAQGLRPDVMISDVNMPGLDGFSLVEALRADPMLATTGVLMLTALDDRASMRQGMKSGADDYLGKPFTRDELLEAIAALLKKRIRIEDGIRLAVQAREDTDRALGQTLAALKDHRFAPGEEPLRLKGFRLVRKIASGHTTGVYLAEREADAMPVVLKVLEAPATDMGASLARFIQEYALLSRIADPHVIRIYDQGFTDDHAYIAMEYFELGDLRTELRSGMFAERAVEVARQVARALHVVHAAGIVHRDLKPENVMLRRDGSVALADFGVAKLLEGELALGLARTRHGEVVGTPYYLSPEQARGGTVTQASDLYSLGVMFYEMLAGRRPFTGETLDLLLALHLTAPPPPLPPDVAGLQPVLDRLLAKAPEDRYASAQALLDDLGRPELLRTFSG